MQRIVFSPRRPATAQGSVAFTALPPLTLYVHVPWCLRKCPYCDFNSHEAKGEIPEQAYVEALIADLEATLPAVWGRRVHAIFFGGGTPSLLSAASIDRLLAAIRARLPLEPDAEITLEHVQSNEAGELVAAIHAARGRAQGIIINPGAFTHYAWSLHDALSAFDGVVVEAHLSQPQAREAWRHTSVIAPVADGTISGFGPQTYPLAVSAIATLLKR